MQRIHCTHCTYKTSLIERTSSQNDNAVVGYSVRSSSIDGTKTDEIRKVFRTVERLLSYDLPQDTPSERKAQLSASSAPRKMVFLSKLGENQAVGVISYRTKDTTGRTGSYFADIVVNNLPRTSSESQPTWTPLTAIQCWPFSYDGSANTNWWCDSEEMTASQGPDGTPLPSPASDLNKLRGTTPAFLNDQLLWAFLTEETIPNSVDKGRVISPRWSNIPVEQRQELFIRVVQAVIDVATSNKPRVVLAVEPSVASLIYYGIFRLLPEKLDSLSPGFSCTTYESRPERSPYTLTATTFDQVENIQTDLNPQLYSESFCCNTFSKEGGFKYSKAYGDSFKAGAYTEKLRQLIQSQDQVNFFKLTDSLLECLKPLPNIASQDLDEAVRLFQEIKNYLLEGVPLPPSSRLLNRSLSDRENILAKNCTCFFLTSHDLKHSPSVNFCVNLINWSGILSAESRTPEGIREKIFNFVPKTSASLSSLLESISPLRLPEDVVFNIVVPITAQNKQIPSGFAHWVKETSKQPDQGKYAEKLLGLLDEDTKSAVSLNALDKFPELLFSVLERESFYRGPNAAKNKSILVECLCAHLKKDNPWQLLLAFPRLTTAIQQVEPSGLNAIVKTLSESLTRAENLQSPPQYLDIQSQRDSHRSLQNLRNWIKLTDNKQSERLIHRYEKLIRKFDEIAEIEDRSFVHKMLSSGVSKRQLQDVLDIIQNLNSSGPPSKTDRPYLHLIEKQFRAAGKDIKGFQRAEAAVEEYKNRVPAKLALTRKKTRRKLSFNAASVAAAILVVLSIGTWLYLSDTTQFNELNETEPKTLVAGNNSSSPQRMEAKSSSGQDPTVGRSANVSPTGGATNPKEQNQNPPTMTGPTKQEESSGRSQSKNPTPVNTNTNEITLVQNLFKLNKEGTHIDTTDSSYPLIARFVVNDHIGKNTRERFKDQLCILLLDENDQEQEHIDYKGQKSLYFQQADPGKSWSIAYSLKTNHDNNFLIAKVFAPAIPKEVTVKYLPQNKKLLFETAKQKIEKSAITLKFSPPFVIKIKNNKNEIDKVLLPTERYRKEFPADQIKQDQLDSLKAQLTPKDLPGPVLSLNLVYIPNKINKAGGPLQDSDDQQELADVPPESVNIDLFLLSPAPEGNALLSLRKSEDGNFSCEYDREKLGTFGFTSRNQWSRKLWFSRENNIDILSNEGLAVLYGSKLLVKSEPKKKQPIQRNNRSFLERDFSDPEEKPNKHLPWNPMKTSPIPEDVYKKIPSHFLPFFEQNLKASLVLLPESSELVHETKYPTKKSGRKSPLALFTFGTSKHKNLAEIYLFLNPATNNIEFNNLNWSQSLRDDANWFARNWTLQKYDENEKVPPVLFTSNLLTGNRSEIWTTIKAQYSKNENNSLNDSLELDEYVKAIQKAYKQANGGEEERYKTDVAYQKLHSIIERLKEGKKLKEYFDKGILVTEFDLFWNVEPRGDSVPLWAAKYYADNTQQRVYWSRFTGQEKEVGGEK